MLNVVAASAAVAFFFLFFDDRCVSSFGNGRKSSSSLPLSAWCEWAADADAADGVRDVRACFLPFDFDDAGAGAAPLALPLVGVFDVMTDCMELDWEWQMMIDSVEEGQRIARIGEAWDRLEKDRACLRIRYK